ncbi:MAG: peptidoglycan editing factor PgeF [Anaerolineales bacterium]
MIVQKSGKLVFYQFPNFTGTSLIHGVFTRLGGVSEAPWDTLNLGGTVGDDPSAVMENLDRLVTALNSRTDQLAQVRQIHSARVVRIDRPVDALEKADAMITNQPGPLLLMRFADCVPILLFDPKTRSAGIAHAGWQGTIKGVASQVVLEMRREYGTDPEDLVVGIGPSIGPDHYQIGSDVIELVEETFLENARQLLIRDGDEVKLDLWKANRINLEHVGVKNIIVSGICTGCNLDHWFSHRAELGRTGRFASVIGLL